MKKRVKHTLSALLLVRDGQVFHHLVRLCSSICRVVHLLRTIPPLFCTDALVSFDCSILNALSRGLGVLFPEAAVRQVNLPLRFGGLGLRRALDHASGAYLASVSGAAAADGWNRAKSVGWFPALEDFCFRAHVLPDTVTGAQAPLKQRQLSFAVDNHIFASLLSSSPLLHKARLLSVKAPGASAWLGVIPSPSLNQVFDSRQFTALVRWWLGLPVYARVSACPTCGVAMDLFGYHALTCRTGGSLGVRHNALREVFLHFCNTSGIRAERESPGLLLSRPSS